MIQMVTTGSVSWICYFIVLSLVHADDDWRPSNPNVTREEFLSTNGLTKEDFDYVKTMMPRLQHLIAKYFGVEEDDTETYSKQNSSVGFLDDVLLTRQEVDHLYSIYSKYGLIKRRKRKIINFGTYPNRMKWPLPISYKIDNSFSRKSKAGILYAIGQWEKNTCIRFNRLNIREKTKQYHILFVKTESLCASYKGLMVPRQDCDTCKGCMCPQTTELNEVCAQNTGKTMHEVGHVIGLAHEHIRPDRDDYVKIIPRNIVPDKMHNFAIQSLVNTYNLPYDYGSIMHYARDTFIRKGRDFVIKTRDPLFQSSMGQEIGLSFWDIKVANLEYCNETCKDHLPCERGGITNPNNCSECICPDGFGGKLCDQVSDHTVNCSDLFGHINNITVDSMGVFCIQTPIPTGPKFVLLKNRMQCNWYLHAAKGIKIQLYFDQDFSWNINYCNPFHCCYDWLEVKYKDNLATPGPRFCGSENPAAVLVSEENEMMVTLRARYTENDFRFCFKG